MKQKQEQEEKQLTIEEVLKDIDRRLTELELLKGHEHNKDGKIVIPY